MRRKCLLFFPRSASRTSLSWRVNSHVSNEHTADLPNPFPLTGRGGRQPRRGLLAACIGGESVSYGGADVEVAVGALQQTASVLEADLRNERRANAEFREGMSREQRRMLRKLEGMNGGEASDEEPNGTRGRPRGRRQKLKSKPTKSNSGWFAGGVTSGTSSALLVMVVVVVGLVAYAAVLKTGMGPFGSTARLEEPKTLTHQSSHHSATTKQFDMLEKDVATLRRQNAEMLKRLEATSLDPSTLTGKDDSMGKQSDAESESAKEAAEIKRERTRLEKEKEDLKTEKRELEGKETKEREETKKSSKHTSDDTTTPEAVNWNDMAHSLGPEIAKTGLEQITKGAVAAAFVAGREAQAATVPTSDGEISDSTSRLALTPLAVEPRPVSTSFESSLEVPSWRLEVPNDGTHDSSMDSGNDDAQLRARAISVARAATDVTLSLETNSRWTERAAVRLRGYEEKMQRLDEALRKRQARDGSRSVSDEVKHGVETVRAWEEKIGVKLSQSRGTANDSLDVLESLDGFVESLRVKRTTPSHQASDVTATLDEWLQTLDLKRRGLRVATARDSTTSDDAEDALVTLRSSILKVMATIVGNEESSVEKDDKKHTITLLGAFAGSNTETQSNTEELSSDTNRDSAVRWFDDISDEEEVDFTQPALGAEEPQGEPEGESEADLPDEAKLGDWYGPQGYRTQGGWQGPQVTPQVTGPTGYPVPQPESYGYDNTARIGEMQQPYPTQQPPPVRFTPDDAATRETVAWAGEMANKLEEAQAFAQAAEEAGRAAAAKAADAAAAVTEEAKKEVEVAEKAESEAEREGRRAKKVAEKATKEAEFAKSQLAAAKAEASAAQALLRNESSRAIDEIQAARDAIKAETRRSNAAIEGAKEATAEIPQKVASLAKQKVADVKKAAAEKIRTERASAEAVRDEIESEVERELEEAQQRIDEAREAERKSEQQKEAAIDAAKRSRISENAAEEELKRLLDLQKSHNLEVALSKQEAERIEQILEDRMDTASEVEDIDGVAEHEKARIEARAQEAESLVHDAREELESTLAKKKALDIKIDAARAAKDARNAETELKAAEVKKAASNEKKAAESAQKSEQKIKALHDTVTEAEAVVRDIAENADDYEFEFQKVDDVEESSTRNDSGTKKDSASKGGSKHAHEDTHAHSKHSKHSHKHSDKSSDNKSSDDSLDNAESAVTAAAESLELELFGGTEDEVDGMDERDSKSSKEREKGDVLEEWHDDYEDDPEVEFEVEVEEEDEEKEEQEVDYEEEAVEEEEVDYENTSSSTSSSSTHSMKASDEDDDLWSTSDFDPSPEKKESDDTQTAERSVLATLGFRDVAQLAFGELEKDALADVLFMYFAEVAPTACPAKRGRVVVGDARETSSKSDDKKQHRKLMADGTLDTSTDVHVVVSCESSRANEGAAAKLSRAEKSSAAKQAGKALRMSIADGSLVSTMRDAGFRIKQAYVA